MRLLSLVAFFPIAACAQQMVSMQTSGDTAIITVRIREQNFVTFSGAPYSAKRITNGAQTRPDGTHIVQNQTALFYRDTAGRNRTEQQVALKDSPYMVTIMDPILGCEYVLDPGNKIAHKLIGVHIGTRPVPQGQMEAARTAEQLMPSTTSANGIAVRYEDLGKKTIQGLSSYGTKTTTTWPPGTHDANDHTVVAEAESWVAPSLGNVVVASRTVEPGTLDSTFTLADVVLAEPDAHLFAPPADYRIVEETADFKIAVPRNPASTVTKLSTHGPTAATISNAPFSASRRAGGVEILADGTRIDRPEQTTFSAWRDSKGRVRTEWPPRGVAPGGVEIKDPTTGFVYNLDYVSHVAYRTSLSAEVSEAAKPADAGYDVAVSPLGSQVVLGVPAIGVRTTTTAKPGAGTSGQTQTKVTEAWTARTEGIVLTEKTTTAVDESTATLRNFSTNEPDPALFQVPASYKIVDEYGNEIQAKR